MTRHRQLLALVCIAALIAGGMLPGAVFVVCEPLAPLGPLFGAVICAIPRAADDVRLPSSPALTVRSPRAPPAA